MTGVEVVRESHNSSRTPWALDNIPPFPAVAIRLLQALSKEDAAIDETARIVAAEPVFSGRVLQMVNSPLFAVPHEVKSISQAILLLGLAKIRAITVTRAMGDFVASALDRKTLRLCWQNSLAGAILSEKLAPSCQLDPDFAYIAGLLRDIGRLALLVKYPEPYANLLAVSGEHSCDLIDTERQLFEIDHCTAGAWLIQTMPFPELHEVVTLHHEPVTGGRLRMVDLVHVADGMADALGFAVLARAHPLDFETVLAELPQPARSRFVHDPQELKAEIESRIRSWD